MLIQIREIILFIHILLGITWLGGILFVGWGVYPAVKRLSFQTQQQFLVSLMKHSHLLLTLAGIGVISTGIALGTILGPLHTIQDLSATSYGRLFSAALFVALLSLLWGALVSYQTTMHMLRNQQLWDYAETGGTKPLQDSMRRVTFISAFEVIGLLFVVWMMVLI